MCICLSNYIITCTANITYTKVNYKYKAHVRHKLNIRNYVQYE